MSRYNELLNHYAKCLLEFDGEWGFELRISNDKTFTFGKTLQAGIGFRSRWRGAETYCYLDNYPFPEGTVVAGGIPGMRAFAQVATGDLNAGTIWTETLEGENNTEYKRNCVMGFADNLNEEFKMYPELDIARPEDFD